MQKDSCMAVEYMVEFPMEDDMGMDATTQSLLGEEERQLVLHIDKSLSLKRCRFEVNSGAKNLLLLEFPDLIKKKLDFPLAIETLRRCVLT